VLALVVVLSVGAAACASNASRSRADGTTVAPLATTSTFSPSPPAPSTTLVPSGLTHDEVGTWKLAASAATALRALAVESGLPAVPVVTGHAGPHVEAAPDTTVPVPRRLQATFAAEIASARNAAARLMTPTAAAKAGYISAAPFAPGDGVHWIRWDLVAAPFDPARPSMLLFSDTTEDARLIAFSYYTRHAGSPPAGFAGSNDRWHQHRGLCITAGRTTGEDMQANACGGIWLNGADLWMLHAWIVPGEANAWGLLAPIDPKWCLDIPGCGPNPLPDGAKP
jgi:hypothetical protein